MSILRRSQAPIALWGGAAALFLALFAVYLKTALPSIGWGDGPDFILSARFLGVAHSTGYPIFTLLGRLFERLPFGEPAFCVNLMNALFGALAVAAFYGAAAELFRSRTVAALTALAAGLSSFMWDRAVEAEVYTLNALFLASALLVLLRRDHAKAIPAFALVGALGLGNHGTFVVPLFFLALYALARAVRKGVWKSAVPAGLFVALLCSVLYLSLPLLAARQPYFSWLRAWDFEAFRTLITGREFWVVGEYNIALSWRAIVELGQSVGRQFTALFWILIPAGALALRRRPLLVAALAAAGGVSALFPILYPTYEKESFFLPMFLIFALFAGASLAWPAAWIAKKRGRGAPVELVFLAAVFLPLLAGLALSNGRRMSEPNAAEAFSRQWLEAAPRDALFLVDHVGNDALIGPLYWQYAKGERTDAIFLHRLYFAFPWYDDYMRERYRRRGVDLAMPESVDLMFEDLPREELDRGKLAHRLNTAEIDVWTRKIIDMNIARRPVFINTPSRFLGSSKSHGLWLRPVGCGADCLFFEIKKIEDVSGREGCGGDWPLNADAPAPADAVLRELAYQARVDLGDFYLYACGDAARAARSFEGAGQIRVDCDLSPRMAEAYEKTGDADKAEKAKSDYKACIRKAMNAEQP